MSLPTIEQMTNLYLYGQQTKPSNLVDDVWIRPDTQTTPYLVETIEYMNTGPGRFATIDKFELVQTFFDPSSHPFTTNNIPQGVYTKAELAAYYGIDYYGLTISQSSYGIEDADFIERAYIWESTAFKLLDSTRFVVGVDGERYMINYGIEPDLTKRPYESFDFVSDSWKSTLANVI